VLRQIGDTLQRIGAVRLETVGKPFDPHLHEAVTREVTDSYPENTVVQELRGGYMFKDRLLRPAQVIVSMRPQAKAEA
jgi:molecular chaperone GrpE